MFCWITQDICYWKYKKKNYTYLLTNHGPVRSLGKGFIRLIDPGFIQLATGFNCNNIQAEISSPELQSRPNRVEDFWDIVWFWNNHENQSYNDSIPPRPVLFVFGWCWAQAYSNIVLGERISDALDRLFFLFFVIWKFSQQFWSRL